MDASSWTWRARDGITNIVNMDSEMVWSVMYTIVEFVDYESKVGSCLMHR